MRSLLVLLALALFGVSPALGVQTEIVAGAGPSTKVAQAFFAAFAKDPACADLAFTVMEGSVKHKGGILNSDQYLFGRTGRPLNADEKALNKDEIFLAKAPITFAKGLAVPVNSLSLAQVKDIFTGNITNWKEVGGPDAQILVIGREPNEALFSVLKEDHPEFAGATFGQIAKKDDEVVSLLTSINGRYGIAFGALQNFSGHNIIKVADFSSGTKLGLVFDKKNAGNPVVVAAQKFAQSKEWRAKLPPLGLIPAN